MRGKTYRKVKEKAPVSAVDLNTAVAFLKENVRVKFDETVELHINLGIDHTKSEQMVRGTVTLPSGTAKQKRIAVFAAETNEQEAATKAGAAIVGGEELIKEIEKTGKLDADIVVSTPVMMPKIARVARILGPQGLMPNPKTGTVSPNPAQVVAELVAGKQSFKMDSLGNIHEAVGKVTWDADRIIANTLALLDAVRAARPATMRGQLIKNCVLKSSMSPGIKITVQ